MLFPVVLAGGSGSRLWPLSVPETSKQFLSLLSSHSLLQETVLRLSGLRNCQSPIVICNQQHRFMVAQHLQAVMPELPDILLEPIARNTAPAVALATLQVLNQDLDAMMIVLPANHVIIQVDSFRQAVEQASELAQKGYLITFGIHPTEPKMEYGYIQLGDADSPGYQVRQFIEKPSMERAIQLVQAGGYLWNSDIFMFQAKVMMAELERLCPEILTACRTALANARREQDFCWLDADAFGACPSISIDYAVMEKTEKAAVIPVEMGWSDVGSWNALWSVNTQDPEGNVIKGDVCQMATTNSFIMAHNKPTAVIGLDNVVVIDTENGLLVARKDQDHLIRGITNYLKMSVLPAAGLTPMRGVPIETATVS